MPFGYGGYGAGGTSQADRVGPSYSDSRGSYATAYALPYFAAGGSPQRRGSYGIYHDPFAASGGGGGGGGAPGGLAASDVSGLPPSRWADINAGGGIVGSPSRSVPPSMGGSIAPAPAPTSSPTHTTSSRNAFWDWLTGTPTGFVGQALSGMAIHRGANPAAANIGGSVANVFPGLINPFLGLANTILGAGANYVGSNYNPRYGFSAPTPNLAAAMPAPSPAPQPALSGSSGGWFGGGSGWTIEETTPAF